MCWFALFYVIAFDVLCVVVLCVRRVVVGGVCLIIRLYIVDVPDVCLCVCVVCFV